MIEIRHLRYFIFVAEELSFTRAAERVHIDQTPLSRAVRDLEEELGVKLFVRTPRRMSLTPAGARLLHEMRKLFIRFEHAKRAVRKTHALYQAPLRIGVADGIAQPMLSDCLNRWRSIVPEVPVELSDMQTCELVGAIKSEDIDVGFSFGVPDDEAIVQAPAWCYRLMAMLPCGHELTALSKVDLSELLAFPLLYVSEKHLPGLHSQMHVIACKYAERAAIAGKACSLSGYVNRIAFGAGVGLGDEGHTQTLSRDDLVVRPLAEDEYITTYVLHKHQRFGLAEPVQRFLTHVSTLT